ncbi:MAG: hypothetical protein AB1942_12565 [Pseudomonadota bacterium]
MRSTSPHRHNAVRDTMWLGKGVSWLVIVGVIAAGALLAWVLN